MGLCAPASVVRAGRGPGQPLLRPPRLRSQWARRGVLALIDSGLEAGPALRLIAELGQGFTADGVPTELSRAKIAALADEPPGAAPGAAPGAQARAPAGARARGPDGCSRRCRADRAGPSPPPIAEGLIARAQWAQGS